MERVLMPLSPPAVTTFPFSPPILANMVGSSGRARLFLLGMIVAFGLLRLHAKAPIANSKVCASREALEKERAPPSPATLHDHQLGANLTPGRFC